MPALIVGPFVLLALAARSLLDDDPLSGWLLGLMVVGTAGAAYLLWPVEFPRGSSFWTVWWVASLGTFLLLPAVLLREGFKRNWFRAVGRRKRRRGKRDRSSAAAEPHHG